MEILKKELVVEINHLLGDVLSFEPADICLTAQDALFTSLSPSEHLSDGSCHTLGIIRCYIEIVWASRFFQT